MRRSLSRSRVVKTIRRRVLLARKSEGDLTVASRRVASLVRFRSTVKIHHAWRTNSGEDDYHNRGHKSRGPSICTSRVTCCAFAICHDNLLGSALCGSIPLSAGRRRRVKVNIDVKASTDVPHHRARCHFWPIDALNCGDHKLSAIY